MRYLTTICLILVLLSLNSCKTVKQTTQDSTLHNVYLHDSVDKYLFVMQTDTVFINHTDSGINQKEKTNTVIYSTSYKIKEVHDTVNQVKTKIEYVTAKEKQNSKFCYKVLAVLGLIAISWCIFKLIKFTKQ